MTKQLPNEVAIIAAVTADGFIARKNDEISTSWTSKEDTKFFVQKTKELGVMIMGNTTFQTIGKALPGRRTIVMTRNPDKHDVEGVEFTANSPSRLLEVLSKEGHETVAICGGSTVYAAFLEQDLVTDIYLTVEPIVFGDGIKFANSYMEKNLQLIDCNKLSDQVILLHYKVRK